jgi:hypothetical protein
MEAGECVCLSVCVFLCVCRCVIVCVCMEGGECICLSIKKHFFCFPFTTSNKMKKEKY